MAIVDRPAPPWSRWDVSRLVLPVGFVIAYALEVLFQPEVFSRYPFDQIAHAVARRLLEGGLVAAAIVAAVRLVEARPPSNAWAYGTSLGLAVLAASAAGVAVYALLDLHGRLSEIAPFLLGQTMRFAILGGFLAVVDGLLRRTQSARAAAATLALERQTLEAQVAQAQLRLLEAQIEPHFLFNTIANLRRTWRVDPRLGERMHNNAMRYLAASLPRMRAADGTLGEETALARAYLELAAVRMGDRLSFSIDLPPALASAAFPRMMLLTLVENSIKHGLTPSDEGGRVEFGAAAVAGNLVVRVTDDGVGLGGADTAGTGLGLANIRARLATQHGRGARLSLRGGPRGGAVATIELPLQGVGVGAGETGGAPPAVEAPA